MKRFRKFPVFCFLISVGASVAACTTTGKREVAADFTSEDPYANFEELARENREGVDYEVRMTPVGKDRQLVMAIHGGNIEAGTTELAEAIAGKRMGYYSFVGLHPDSRHLHLTSTHFDEPRLESLLAEATRCLSVHGSYGREADFCVGGGNASARALFTQVLKTKFPEWTSCDLCCPPLNGTAKKNIVNRCHSSDGSARTQSEQYGTSVGGVQIEMSPRVRDRIREDAVFRRKLAKTLRDLLPRIE